MENVTVGENLTFRIYGSVIKGDFIKKEGDSIHIKTTQDFLGGIGEEQKIHKSHLSI